jgi:hypothetical protein
MVESHFFRRVSERDANTISIFRMTRPLAALLAPVFASLILFSGGGYLAFFLVSGCLVAALGIVSAIGIHDIEHRKPGLQEKIMPEAGISRASLR